LKVGGALPFSENFWVRTSIGWQVFCLGRSAANEPFYKGACRQRFELWQEAVPLWMERAKLDGNSQLLSAPWGLISATVIDEVLVCRYVGDHAEAVRWCFTHAWSMIRPGLLDRSACPPRIWRT
jgi:urease accessory protein